MDGITLTVLGSVLGSQFYVVYRLGKIEEEIKEIKNKMARL